MKNNIRHIIAFVSCIGLFACSAEETVYISGEKPSDANLMSITASHTDVPTSKTILTPNYNNPQNGLSIAWAKNDMLRLIRTADGIHAATDLLLVEGAGEKTGTFNGKPLPTTESPAPSYQAFYPASKGGDSPEEWRKNAIYDGQVQKGFNNTDHLAAYDYLQTAPLPDLSKNFPFYHTGLIFCFDITLPEGIGTTPQSLTLATVDEAGNNISSGGLFRDCNRTPASSITLGMAQCPGNATRFQAYMILACDIPEGQNLRLLLTLSDGTRYFHKLKAIEAITSPTPGGNTKGISYFIEAKEWTPVTSSVFSKNTSTGETPAGAGSAEDPYRITNAKEFKYLVSNPANGKHYRLDTDITIAKDATWVPIGSSDKEFDGTFDGNGHIIKGDSIQNGIFGYIDNAEIKDLTVIANITYNAKESHIGSIVCRSSNSTISNCHYKGTLTYIYNGTQSSIGGIVGNGDKNTISGCTTHGTIQGEAGDASIPDCSTFGGIIGKGNGNHIHACHNYAEITGGTFAKNSSYTGGIIGNVYGSSQIPPGTISGCHNYGIIQAHHATGTNTTSHAGGIAGSVSDMYIIDVCNHAAVITNETKSRNNTGGIIGYLNTGSSLFRAINTGNVTGYNNGKYDSRTGGLVGYIAASTGTIHQCHNSGNVTFTGTTANDKTYLGTYAGHSTANLHIYDCCSSNPDATIDKTENNNITLLPCTESHLPLQP